MIERGWTVVAADGTEVGKVEETVGDSARDIFNGLTVATSFFGKARYVPAERVGEITEGRVELTLAPAEVERLGGYEEPPPSGQVVP
jgi:Uncharacterized protein conserved in bacteria (DUF2171)